jgi:hypothetical protein
MVKGLAQMSDLTMGIEESSTQQQTFVVGADDNAPGIGQGPDVVALTFVATPASHRHTRRKLNDDLLILPALTHRQQSWRENTRGLRKRPRQSGPELR